MLETIDLSQEIYSGMPVFHGLPEVKISAYASHEERDGITDGDIVSPAVNRLEMGEHTGARGCDQPHGAPVPGAVDRYDAPGSEQVFRMGIAIWGSK